MTYLVDTRGPKNRWWRILNKAALFIAVCILSAYLFGCTNTPNVQVQGVEVAHTEQVKKQHQGEAEAMMIIGGAVAAGGVLSLPVLEDRGDGALAYPIIMGGAGAALILSGVIYYLAEE